MNNVFLTTCKVFYILLLKVELKNCADGVFIYILLMITFDGYLLFVRKD